MLIQDQLNMLIQDHDLLGKITVIYIYIHTYALTSI